MLMSSCCLSLELQKDSNHHRRCSLPFALCWAICGPACCCCSVWLESIGHLLFIAIFISLWKDFRLMLPNFLTGYQHRVLTLIGHLFCGVCFGFLVLFTAISHICFLGFSTLLFIPFSFRVFFFPPGFSVGSHVSSSMFLSGCQSSCLHLSVSLC